VFLKGSLCAVVKLLPCDQEVTDSSCGNSLLQKLQGKAAFNDPMWSNPSPDPAQSGSFMHRAALFILRVCFYLEQLISMAGHGHSSWQGLFFPLINNLSYCAV
jgi:hypothetical protein